MKKLKLPFVLMLFVFSFIQQAQSNTFIVESSIQYSDLNGAQREIYDRVRSSIDNQSEIYFITVDKINDPDNEGLVDVEMSFLASPKLTFQSNFVRFNSENDYAWNGTVVDINSNITCLDDKCDTITGDSSIINTINGDLTFTAMRDEKSGHLMISGDNYNIVDLTGDVHIVYQVFMPEKWCGISNKEPEGNVPPPNNPDGGGGCIEHKLRVLVLYTPKALLAAQQRGTTPHAGVRQIALSGISNEI